MPPVSTHKDDRIVYAFHTDLIEAYVTVIFMVLYILHGYSSSELY
jgi:hypothetical protein